MNNYTGYGVQGKNYQYDLDLKDIAKIVKTNLQKEYPACKFSVTIERYSMGQSLHISLMEAPFEALLNKGSLIKGQFVSMEEQGYKFEKYAQLNQYQFKNGFRDESASGSQYPDGWNNGAILSKKAWDCMKRAYHLATSYNYDDSDGMIDYFDTNFYLHLNIGKWDKPFQVSNGKSVTVAKPVKRSSVLQKILED